MLTGCDGRCDFQFVVQLHHRLVLAQATLCQKQSDLLFNPKFEANGVALPVAKAAAFIVLRQIKFLHGRKWQSRVRGLLNPAECQIAFIVISRESHHQHQSGALLRQTQGHHPVLLVFTLGIGVVNFQPCLVK